MFEKTLPFSNRVWYYKSKANIRSENMFDFSRTEKILSYCLLVISREVFL